MVGFQQFSLQFLGVFPGDRWRFQSVVPTGSHGAMGRGPSGVNCCPMRKGAKWLENVGKSAKHH